MGNVLARGREGGGGGGGRGGETPSNTQAWIVSPLRRRQCREALQRDLDTLLEIPAAKQVLDWSNDEVVQMRSAVHCLQNCMVMEEDTSMLRQFARRLGGLSVRGSAAARRVDSLNTSSCSTGSSCASTPKRVSFRDVIVYEDAGDEEHATMAADERSTPPAPVLEERPILPDAKCTWEHEAQASPLLSEADTMHNSFADRDVHAATKLRGQVHPAELTQAISDLRQQLDCAQISGGEDE